MKRLPLTFLPATLLTFLTSATGLTGCDGGGDTAAGGGGQAGSGGNGGTTTGTQGGGTPGGGVPQTCAAALAQQSYIGCEYWPTITSNSQLFDGFEFAIVAANSRAHSGSRPCSERKNSAATAVRTRARSAAGTGQSPGSPAAALRQAIRRATSILNELTSPA